MTTFNRHILTTVAAVLVQTTLAGEDWSPAEEAFHRAAWDVYVEACAMAGVESKDTVREGAKHALDLALTP